MQHRPRASPSLRNSSSTAYLPRPPPPSFRTLLKRRNETIASSQLYEPQPSPSPKNGGKEPQSPSSARSHSQNSLHPPQTSLAPASPNVAIKQFVKTMGAVGRINPQKQMENSRNNLQDEEREGQKSARSTRSVVSNCSRNGLRRDPSEAVAVKTKAVVLQGQPKTLSEVQRRVEALISEAFALFKKGRTSGTGVTRLAGSELRQLRERQLEELMSWYRENGSSLSAEGGEERLQDLSRKIQLIEKMMAHGTVEGELMQEAYFGWKNQRGNTTSFSKSTILKDSAKYNASSSSTIFKQRQTPPSTKGKQLVGRYDSASKAAFTRPPPQSYLNPHPKRSSYSANRQPLPRSSYASQFLNYGQLPSYSYKPSAVRMEPETSLAVTASTYQQEYKDKLALTGAVSFTDLDCYRNKIQRTDISFMNASRKDQKITVGSSKKGTIPAAYKENMCASSIKRSQEESLLTCMNMSTSCMFRSEHQKEFFWRNTVQTEEGEGDGGLRAEIKDRRLDKLKESFRALAKRR